jgi:uncharacterized membrane protein
MSIPPLVTLFILEAALAFLAAFIVQRSIAEALKGLRLALKSELTTDVGRLNLIAMILIVFVIVVFNLHEMVASALSVGGSSQTNSHVLAPAALIGVFFIGSLICVMLMERKQ